MLNFMIMIIVVTMYLIIIKFLSSLKILNLYIINIKQINKSKSNKTRL